MVTCTGCGQVRLLDECLVELSVAICDVYGFDFRVNTPSLSSLGDSPGVCKLDLLSRAIQQHYSKGGLDEIKDRTSRALTGSIKTVLLALPTLEWPKDNDKLLPCLRSSMQTALRFSHMPRYGGHYDSTLTPKLSEVLDQLLWYRPAV